MIDSFNDHYIVVCTARVMTKADYEFLSDTGLHFHEILREGLSIRRLRRSRMLNISWLAFQDSLKTVLHFLMTMIM